MIVALAVVALMWWGYWLVCRDAGPPRRSTQTPVAAPIHTSRDTLALGPRDDADQWHATRGAWTALDERQLTRLLTESARTAEAATDPGQQVPPVGGDDTPTC